MRTRQSVPAEGREPQTKSEKTRLRILDAAARVFRDQGYSAARLTDIARAADTQAGSLYYHFDSKEHLLDAVLQRGHERVSEAVRAEVEALGPAASHREKLHAAIRTHLEMNLRHNDYAAANIHFSRQVPEPIRERHIRQHRRYAAYWQDLLEEAQRAGEIREDIDISVTRLNLFGMMNWSVEWYRPGRLGIDELAQNMWRTLFEGIGAARHAVAEPVR